MKYVVECACGCGSFEAGSPRAKWKTPGCKKRAQRQAGAEAAGTVTGDPTAGRRPEDPLVLAVRKELGDRANTVDGEIAIHLARQVKAATGSAAAGLAKELRQVLDRVAAGGTPAPGPDPTPEPEVDEVTRAREARERKAREAAAR